MSWEINGTTEFEEWFLGLPEEQQDKVIEVVETLEEHGPHLGRPFVDRLKGSLIHNLKELRPRGAARHLRILFAFDPARQAVLLLGGNKAGQWSDWYSAAIPRAEALYRAYLREMDQPTEIETET